MDMAERFDLFNDAKKQIRVVAHRGACGGNIPCNTMAAYNIAIKQGADMIEIDVNRSADGTLFIFHPGMEHALLNDPVHSVPKMTDAEIAALRYVNQDDTPTQFGLNTLDEIFEAFKGRCYINVDKFWDNPAQIAETIRRHDIADQVVVKSSLSREVLSVLEETAPELMFMPIVQKVFPEHGEMLKKNVNYIGAEVLFDDENDEVCSDAFIAKMHADGKLVWVNSIIYSYRAQLAAGHSDDTALTESEEKGWGWLADKGFDLIQTDWPLMLIEFLKKTGRYER